MDSKNSKTLEAPAETDNPNPSLGSAGVDNTLLSPAQPSLADQLCEVRSRLRGVPKNGSMKLGGAQIEYVRIDDLMEALRPVFAACGVDFRVSHSPDHPPTREGKDWLVLCRFTYTSSLTGEVAQEWGWGQGSSIAIAQSFAVKYHLLRSLLIGGGDADDEVANTGGQPQNGQAQGNGSKSRAVQRNSGNSAPKAPVQASSSETVTKKIYDLMRVHDLNEAGEPCRRAAAARVGQFAMQFPDRMGPLMGAEDERVKKDGSLFGFPNFAQWTPQQLHALEMLYLQLNVNAEEKIPF